ncbi:MAG: tRNA (cytidine(56)-2'-O)-methyltransferase [Euryarchaeota archaeon]|nr:tRNA (cytidine(56)-2'-O)-methyltransferase [Euryarchaeota archaeon]|tara:strand:+ start:8549 stop:9124 length:576 start_codon:yes stop_codon:yes gene_type:complete
MPNHPAPITVVRLGYRIGRDPRINTHLGLVARALGADEFLVSGDKNNKMFDTIEQVTKTFGGKFKTNHLEAPLKWIKKYKLDEKEGGVNGTIIHLTMYGEDYRKVVPKIPKNKPLAIIVGGAKVPASIYRMCHYNVSVGNQPHSEVAALALFLDKLQDGNSIEQNFSNPKLEIIPDLEKKNVIDHTKKEEE